MKIYRKLYLDLETTVYPGQETTEAWSVCIGGDGLKEPLMFPSIPIAWKWIKKQNGNLLIYIHNLKFDGTYWIDFFERSGELKQAVRHYPDGKVQMGDVKHIFNNEYIYNISSKGIWYNLIIKQKSRLIELRDSLKLLPFKLREIGEAFETEHKKLEMDYGNKGPGYNPTKEEQDYIKNDIYVLQEAMEIMIKEGHTKMTIGSCCMAEYKKLFEKDGFTSFKAIFPDLYKIKLNPDFFDEDKTINYSVSQGEYILNSYKGAFCYYNPKFAGKKLGKGFTLDVTSLYPSVMHSISGNKYPYGKGVPWKGNTIPEIAQRDNFYYFVRFRCAFEVKEGMLPFVQIKGDWRYKGTEHLKTSAIYNSKTKTYNHYVDGKLHTVTLTMCEDEYKLFLEHYDVYNFEILDGMYFTAAKGLFDPYINKWAEIKNTSKGALRQLAKLFLNNLYGKFASTPNSSYKLCFLQENRLHYQTVIEHEKIPGYIPIGSAITAKARCFTIRAAQANIDIFCYADTDSIHCIGNVADVKGVEIAKNKLYTWKHECDWTEAIFARQKTYIERWADDGELHITCAGMPDRCKELFAASIDRKWNGVKNLKQEELEFILKPRTLEDFKIGLVVPSKTYSKIIPGGTLLYEDYYRMH